MQAAMVEKCGIYSLSESQGQNCWSLFSSRMLGLVLKLVNATPIGKPLLVSFVAVSTTTGPSGTSLIRFFAINCAACKVEDYEDIKNAVGI